MEDKFVYIGKIVNTHGIKGEIRILSDFEYKDKVFVPNMKIYIGRKKEQEVIQTYRHHKNFEMITMKGYTNINEVLKYKGLYVYVDKEDLKLSSLEILDSDLINLTVIVEGIKKGTIKDIRKMNGNHKLLEIETEKDSKMILIPYQKEFVSKIDLTNHQIILTPIKGMFE